jgi:hypothetical protein
MRGITVKKTTIVALAAQAALGAVEVCKRRRRHRGRYSEENLKGNRRR